MHKNRTTKGLQKEIQIQETYDKWWLGKFIKRKDRLIKITGVNYCGNSVYGCVLLKLENGSETTVSTNSFRPRKYDLQVFDQEGKEL